MAKTITISDKLYARLEQMAADKLDGDSYADGWYDAASWGNVDDAMNWAMCQAECMLAHEILKGESN